MGPLISWCWRLSLFRANPNQLPQSLTFMIVLTVVSLFVFILSLVGYVAVPTAIGVTAYILVSQMVLIYLVLAAAHKQERFVKTMTAILLVSLLFQFIALPAMFLMYQVQNINPLLIITLEAAIMFVQVWLMFVHAYIINCAIDVGQIVAFLIVFAMSVVQLKCLDLLISV